MREVQAKSLGPLSPKKAIFTHPSSSPDLGLWALLLFQNQLELQGTKAACKTPPPPRARKELASAAVPIWLLESKSPTYVVATTAHGSGKKLSSPHKYVSSV